MTHPPSWLQLCVTHVVWALFPHTSLMTSAAAWQMLFYQFLLINYLPSCKSRASWEICNVCSPMSLQGQMFRCAQQCNFVIRIYLSCTIHIAFHQRDAKLYTWLEGLSWGKKSSIHLNQNNVGKVERGCFWSCLSLQEKKGQSYLWVKRPSSFFSLATIYTSKGQWCDDDYTLVVSMSSWPNCYRTAQLNWSAAISLHSGTNRSLLITVLCTQMVADQFV